jgi:hypothetical protein
VVHYSRRIVVPVSLGETFGYLSRFSSAAEWDPSVTGARMVTPEPVRLGSVFELDAVFMGNTVPLRYEITDFDPPNRVVLAAENASVRSSDEILFSRDTSGGTVIQYNADLVLKGVVRFAAPIFALAFRRLGNRASEGLLATLSARAPRPRGRQW